MAIAEASAHASAVVYRDAEHAIAVCRNALLTYSLNGPNPRFLEAWTARVEQIVTELHAPLLAMTIIGKSTKPPDEDSRRRVRSTLDQHAREICGFAYVVEGEGFGPAAVRSALSLITMAARFPFPLKVFGHVEEAAPWLLKHPCDSLPLPGSAELVNLASRLRDSLSPVVATG